MAAPAAGLPAVTAPMMAPPVAPGSPASQRTLLGVVEISAAAKREKHQGEQAKPQIPHRVLHDGRYFAVWSVEADGESSMGLTVVGIQAGDPTPTYRSVSMNGYANP